MRFPTTFFTSARGACVPLRIHNKLPGPVCNECLLTAHYYMPHTEGEEETENKICFLLFMRLQSRREVHR